MDSSDTTTKKQKNAIEQLDIIQARHEATIQDQKLEIEKLQTKKTQKKKKKDNIHRSK